jgi:hypothetical protein
MLVDSSNWRTIQMSQNQTAKMWREHLVNKLRDRYGLAEKQAQVKADKWLQWIKRQTSFQPQNLMAADVGGESDPAGRDSNIRSSKPRSAGRRVFSAHSRG